MAFRWKVVALTLGTIAGGTGHMQQSFCWFTEDLMDPLHSLLGA